MKIFSDLNSKILYTQGFKSERTDKNTVLQLKSGENPISENNKINIQTALINLSAVPKRENIEFLLDIADNLTFGEFGNAKFKSELDKDGITPQNRENTDWNKLLKDTIERAISLSKDSTDELEIEFKKTFAPKTELTPEQTKILELRKKLTEAVTDKKLLQTQENIEMAAEIRKNLDYFAASSEIPAGQKIECLKKLIFFMSDDYKINPQLEDKKLQVTNEILNDLIIKTPGTKELTIKSVDQRVTGICAAISVCRKAMAYENKTGFIDVIMEELKDSPVMSVYDITELGSGKKVEIPKTDIKYADALNKGYRIIDASAHIWMDNAHAGGDGTIQTEHYIPFDDDTYGIYDDSSWYKGLNDEISEKKILLGALIKEKEYLKSVYSTKSAMTAAQNNIAGIKSAAFIQYKRANGTLNKEISGIFPDKTQREINEIIRKLIDFYTKKSDENEVFISDKMSDAQKQNSVAEFLQKQEENLTDKQKDIINAKSKTINQAMTDYVEADEKINKLHRFNSLKSKFSYKRKLYKAAAAHRLAIEADVNLSDGALRFEKSLKLPPRNKQIVNYLNSIGEKTGNKGIIADSFKIGSIIPEELDKTIKKLTGNSMADILGQMLTVKDKNKTGQKTEKLAEKTALKPSKEEFFEVIRQMGYENEFDFAFSVVNSYTNSLKSGISEQEYKRLSNVFGGKDNIKTGINNSEQKIINLANEYAEIIDKWKVPSSRELIIDKMEQQNYILSRKNLNTLKKHFLEIENQQANNEKIPNMKEREKANNKLYTFSSSEEDILKKIEKNLSLMKKYSNIQYNNLNKILFNNLEEQYSAIGMLNGQFWVLEEGSSGLMANEKLRIMEQMTGKPYHIEKDVKEAVKQIKKGEGSGVIAMSVDDSDYAFHAMYLPAVTEEVLRNEEGQEEKKDILWADNSWGLAEKEHFWHGSGGFRYTDYNRGFGWKNGFILKDNLTIGLPVDDMFGAKGISKEDKEEFGLFRDIILPGTPINTHQKLLKMFGYIFNINEGEEQLNKLEDIIKNGSKIDIDFLTRIDELAEAKHEVLSKRIKNEIKTKENFNKLDDNDPIKFEFEKLALYLSSDNPNSSEEIFGVTDRKELEEVKESILDEHVNTIGMIIAKSEDCIDKVAQVSMPQLEEILNNLKDNYNISFDENEKAEFLQDIYMNDSGLLKLDGSIDTLENYLLNQIKESSSKHIKNEEAKKYFDEKAKEVIENSFENEIRITSLESNAITSNPLSNELIAAIDKHFNPASDEELLKILQDLQNSTFEEADKFIEKLSEEDLGLKIKEPYEYLQLYLADNAEVTKAFTELVETEEIYRHLSDNDDETKSTPEELYRSLHVKLAEMDVQKYIKAFKDEAFQKYKVRQAFPQPVVIKDEEIEKMVVDILQLVRNYSDNIENNKSAMKLLDTYNKLNEDYIQNEAVKPLLNGTNADKTQIEEAFLKGFIQTVNDLYNLTKDEDGISYMTEPLYKLKKELCSNRSIIDGEKTSEYIKQISSNFKEFELSDITSQKFKEANRINVREMRNIIKALVNSNVEPKYRDNAVNIIKDILKLYREANNEQEIANQEEKLISLIKEKHIVKNPTGLLKEYIKLVQSGKEESGTAQGLRSYLTAALNVAQQTKIQYKLVQNQHEAISSKTKDMLPLFYVTMEDGTKQPMSGDIGMLYLISQLQNYNDNNVILKLFLAQTGMSKPAVKALINNTDINILLDDLKNQFNKVKKDIKDTDKIVEEADKFLNQSKIKYKSPEDCIKQFIHYMQNKLKSDNSESIYKKYIDYISSIDSSGYLKSSNTDVCNALLNKLYGASLEYIADDINSQIDNINEYIKNVSNKLELINSIEIPQNSEEYNIREKFNEQFNQIYKLSEIEEILIKKALAQCPVFDSEETDI